MSHLIKSIVFFLYFGASAFAQAQADTFPHAIINGVYPEVKAPISLFADESVMHLELTADFNKLLNQPGKSMADKMSGAPSTKSPTKFPAQLTYFTDGQPQQLSVDLTTRGESKLEFCSGFRPIRIYFQNQNNELATTPFNGVSEDLKVATHCQGLGVIPDTNANVQRNLREQTAYKMLEALGFMSLKTRSAMITYKNLDGKVVAKARAFLLEPKSNMAKRYGLKHIPKHKADIVYAPEPENKISFLFATRFLMHTDVDYGGEHNTILLIRKGEPKAVAMVPYDFDLTGMVIDAGYLGAAHAYKWWTPQGWGDDGDWLKKQISAPYTSQSYKDLTYSVAAYAVSHKDQVQKTIDTSEVIDKSLIQARVDAFFSGIERTLGEK